MLTVGGCVFPLHPCQSLQPPGLPGTGKESEESGTSPRRAPVAPDLPQGSAKGPARGFLPPTVSGPALLQGTETSPRSSVVTGGDRVQGGRAGRQ